MASRAACVLRAIGWRPLVYSNKQLALRIHENLCSTVQYMQSKIGEPFDHL